MSRTKGYSVAHDCFTKTIRIPKSDIVSAFIASQKNFSQSMYYLILEEMRKNGGQPRDIARDYHTRFEEYLVQGIPVPEPQAEAREAPMPLSAEPTVPAAPKKAPHPIPQYAAPMESSSSALADDDDIPDCYK